MNEEELYGLSLRYYIGKKDEITFIQPNVISNEIYEVGYEIIQSPKAPYTIKYGNLLDQTGTELNGPYLKPTGTALAYNQKVPDPKKPGYYKNIHTQLERAQRYGFKLIEWDNADTEYFELFDLKRVLDLSLVYRIGVIFKNPGLIKFDVTSLIAHPNVFGIIVEENCGLPGEMDKLRCNAKKPLLSVWFVSYGPSFQYAQNIADQAKNYLHMGVTHSSQGKYENSIDLLRPIIKVKDQMQA